jgi:hypothetical protein
MALASLPRYPSLQRAASAPRAPEIVLKFSLRMTRVFVSVAFLVILAVALYELRETTMIHQAPPSAPPLDFKLVEERYSQVYPPLSREKVAELLGPPTERYA